MADVFDTLKERGFVYQDSDETGLRAALERPLTVYCGYDPTASSLTHGHLVTIMMLAHLQRAGHRPIALVGGGTGMIGDPSDKSSARPLLSVEEIDANVANIRGQLSRYLEFGDGRAELVDNAEWLRTTPMLDFLRDVGRHFSVNVMLDLEFVRTRLASQAGLSYLEFSYILLQASDFLELYRRYGCTLQVGGSDQWANILAGADLIRRVEGGRAYGLVAPLITASSGRKVSKSEGNAIFLDPALTSPYEFYQFWINTEDVDVERYLAIYTFLPMEEVRALGRLEGAELRRAKEVLAYEVTKLTHGEEEARRAEETSRALFRGDAASLEAAPTFEVTGEEITAGVPIVDLLVRTGLEDSKNNARKRIDQRGVRLNGEVIVTVDRMLGEADFAGDAALLQRGKKTFRRVVVK
ncbi:MAG: tyrosine--tRNA ligase [Dehalococcoidia bacterium]